MKNPPKPTKNINPSKPNLNNGICNVYLVFAGLLLGQATNFAGLSWYQNGRQRESPSDTVLMHWLAKHLAGISDIHLYNKCHSRAAL